MRYSFCKSERLTHKSLFEELFLSGRSFIKYPFRILVKESTLAGDYSARIAISVSKKRIKSAVKRNKIKRLTREAYRQNKEILSSLVPLGFTYDIIFIYIDNQLPVSYFKIEKSIKAALENIANQIIKE